MERRNFLRGLLAAPVVITTPGLLMQVTPAYDLAPPALVWGGGGAINRTALRDHLWPSMVEFFSPPDMSHKDFQELMDGGWQAGEAKLFPPAL